MRKKRLERWKRFARRVVKDKEFYTRTQGSKTYRWLLNEFERVCRERAFYNMRDEAMTRAYNAGVPYKVFVAAVLIIARRKKSSRWLCKKLIELLERRSKPKSANAALREATKEVLRYSMRAVLKKYRKGRKKLRKELA